VLQRIFQTTRQDKSNPAWSIDRLIDRQISAFMPGRSENDVKNRANNADNTRKRNCESKAQAKKKNGNSNSNSNSNSNDLPEPKLKKVKRNATQVTDDVV